MGLFKKGNNFPTSRDWEYFPIRNPILDPLGTIDYIPAYPGMDQSGHKFLEKHFKMANSLDRSFVASIGEGLFSSGYLEEQTDFLELTVEETEMSGPLMLHGYVMVMSERILGIERSDQMSGCVWYAMKEMSLLDRLTRGEPWERICLHMLLAGYALNKVRG